MVEVMRAEREHLDGVLELVWDMKDTLLGTDSAREITRAEAAMREIVSGNRTGRDFFLAVAGGRPVGVAGFVEVAGTDRAYRLSYFGVVPDMRGRGVGGMLLKAVEEALNDRGARLLLAETSHEAYAAPARLFYLARGFGLVATVDDFWQDGEGLALFLKRLGE